ncbi:MAG: hypothetical protein KAT35_00235, partial [Candidatus Aenigmarchaeota archaeon]|nr:hypothetical protein [Candidatus Aenigmarchaeota archaeon]
MPGDAIINLTNSSPESISTTQQGFTFVLANSTYGVLAERGKNAPYNMTINCTFTNGTTANTFNVTNSTNFTIDWTVPSVSLVSPAQLLVNNTNGTLLYRFTVVDLGTNASNCTVFLGWTNTTYSLAPSFTMAENITSPVLGDRANATYITTQTTSLLITGATTGATPNQADATHYWKVRCYDYAGNYADSANRSYIIDNSTPAYVTLVGPANNTAYRASQTVAFQWNVSDAFLKNCSVMMSYGAAGAGNFELNKTVTHSEDFVGNDGNWNATILFNHTAGTNQMFINLGGNSPTTMMNWTVTCYDLWGHNTTNHTWFYIPVSNETGGGGVSGGSGLGTAPEISAVVECAGETTTITITGIKTQATVTLFRTGVSPIDVIHTTTMTSDGSFNIVLPAKGEYEVQTSAVGQSHALYLFSVTCIGEGVEEEEVPVTPPVTPPEEEEEEPTVPPEEEEEPPILPEVTSTDAQNALDSANVPVVAAVAEGKDVAAAQDTLADAQAAYDAGDYALVLTLANEAQTLAASAAMLPEEEELPPVT